jgi:hypothetical protein
MVLDEGMNGLCSWIRQRKQSLGIAKPNPLA